MTRYEFENEYEEYEARYDPRWQEQWRSPKHRPKREARRRSRREELAEVTDGAELAESFTMSYPAARFEEWWLLDSLRDFYSQNLVKDVVARIKGGKEANVYRCVADPSTGHGLAAAKVYRPRKLRNLRNDKLYRQGRPVLNADGHAVKTNDHRIMRALGKKSAFGQQVAHTSWLMYEYRTLQTLHGEGGAVPEPLGVGDNAILMGYRGDERRAAPTLHEVRIGREEASRLFEEAMWNVELMLRHGLIHGDLSAFNILYWEGKLTLIDFPQVTSVESNGDAEFILRRDIQRLCDYFVRRGVACDAVAIADDLWREYGLPPIHPLLDPNLTPLTEEEMREES